MEYLTAKPNLIVKIIRPCFPLCRRLAVDATEQRKKTVVETTIIQLSKYIVS